MTVGHGAKDKASLDLQPTVFLYGYRQTHGELPDFRFDVIVKNKTPSMEQHRTHRDQDHFDRMVRLVRVAESMIAAEHFLPCEQSFYCGNCPFQEACRNWHRQASRVTVPKAA